MTLILGQSDHPIYGEATLSNYEEILLTKEYEQALSGLPLDEALILKASEAFQKIPDNLDSPYILSEEFLTFAKPYYSIFELISESYAKQGSPFKYKDFQNISKEYAENFYEINQERHRTYLENNPLFSDENIEAIMNLYEKVNKPIILQYDAGYERFISLSTTNTILIMICIAFIVAPIFSNEYQGGTDSLILSTRNGRKSQSLAKIFTAISVSVGVTIIFLAVCYFTCMLVYGFEGANAQLQNYTLALNYNFTMMDCVILLCITTCFGGFLLSGISLFVSSFSSQSMIPLSISFIIIMVGILKISLNGFEYFLPTAVGRFWNVIGLQLSWNIFGVTIWLYQAVCIVAFAISSLLFILTYFNFKRHQVG
ncbi:MAG: hypothetical protein ATN31_10940 [Candidatus Epulonipiscioides saccharophilum]|nr:MAG: hypothetical protein ATN31_10940 [Epulopiscium sp. AS2M-Bin001]